MKQASNERKPYANLASKPPIQYGNVASGHGLDGAALSNLTGKAQVPSKWSINIQEIVKRTQKNLERGPASSKATAGGRVQSSEAASAVEVMGSMQYLSKHMKSGFGSSSTKDKSSLLYHDLKKKLSYDSGPQQDISAGLRRKDNNLLGLSGQPSSQTAKPGTGSANQIGAKSLYLVNQKTSAISGQSQNLHERLAIARLKRRSTEEAIDSNSQEGNFTYNHGQRRHNQAAHSANEISGTAGSIQGTQGGGEMYADAMFINNMTQQHMSLEERALNHQRTLMQAGRLNLIGASEQQQMEDDEAQLIDGNSRDQHFNAEQTRIELRRHNSNMNRPSTMNLAVQDQTNDFIDDSQQAIAEACMTDEQTQRNQHEGNTSMERLGALMERSLEEPTVRTTNNFLTDNTSRGDILKMNHLRPSNSTGGGTQQLGIFTDTQNKRQTTDLKTRILLQNNHNSNTTHDVGHRQKIFEEEIIKRIKEIQRYVKSLHLQIKKTQSSHEKLKDEVEIDKDVLVSLQQNQELQNKKYQNDRIKQVSSSELESSLKDIEMRYNEKLVLVVQEAADQTLKQVNNEIIPEARLKMYDSITEETNRLKLDLEYQLQAFKREIGDSTKKDRTKSSEMIEQEVLQLRNEIKAEQSTQTLSVLSQVDAQIAKALKENKAQTEFQQQNQSFNRKELESLKNELHKKVQQSETKTLALLRQESKADAEKLMSDFEQRLAELESRTLRQLTSKLSSQSDKFITPELLSEKLLTLKQDLTKSSQRDIKKASESQKSLFVQPEQLQAEIQKLSKQVKTSIEEAKFDTVQMMQSDVVEVSNQQKDARFKVQELVGRIQDIQSQMQEAMQRMTNREKEQTQLQMRAGQLQEKQSSLDIKLETLSAEVREIQAREIRSPVKSATPVKEDQAYDSHRSAPNAFALEELESLRDELKEVSNKCNLNQSTIEQTKMEVSNNKSSMDKQIKAVKGQIDDASKQIIDVQFEAGQNKQFLEDQLAELTQSTEALQERIRESREAGQTEISSVRSDVQKLEQSCERQFTNLNNGVTLLEEWQAKMQQMNADMTAHSSGQKDQQTLQTDDDKDEANEKLAESVAALETQMTSANAIISKLDARLNQVSQEMLQEVAQVRSVVSKEAEKSQEEREEQEQALKTEIGALQAMFSTLSERNNKLEDDFTICMSQVSVQGTALDQLQARQVMEKDEGQSILTKCQLELSDCRNALEEQLKSTKEQLTALETRLEQQVIVNQADAMAATQQRPKSFSQQSPQSKWQESSIKKVQASKQTAEWAELRMTKIEPKESSVRTSIIAGETSQGVLKSKPPVQQAVLEQEQIEEPVDQVSEDQSSANNHSASQPPQMSFDHDDEKEQNQKQSATDAREQAEDLNNAAAAVVVVDDGLSAMIGKPTEYSASVNETVQDHVTKRGEQIHGEIEIKSPVQFEMMPESDVKVNETNSSKQFHSVKYPISGSIRSDSSQANLLIQDRMAYNDDNNLNDQIISPSEGIQVPNASEFYKLQREIRSNQVQKKTDMLTMIKQQTEQEVESEKVDSPRPLDVDIIDDSNGDICEESADLAGAAEQARKQGQPAPLEKSLESGLLLQSSFKDGKLGGKTTAQLELDFGGVGCGFDNQNNYQKHCEQLNEQTQLFRTQKMSGLAQLSQKATHKNVLEGLDAHDLELQMKMDEEASDFEKSSNAMDDQLCEESQEDLRLQQTPSEEDDDLIDGLPASSVILGMKLDKGAHYGFGRNMPGLPGVGHERKLSDGKSSSVMGLSALGLESQRESQNELASENQNAIKELEAEMRDMLQDRNQIAIESPEKALSDDQGSELASKEEMVLDVVGALVSLEIEQALLLMKELRHPNVFQLTADDD